MQATLPPWAWGWSREALARRRLRVSLSEIRDLRGLSVDWSRLARPDIALGYTPNQIRQIIRLDGALPRGVVATPPTWLRDRLATDVGATWRLPEVKPLPPSPPAGAGWAGALRGWGAAAALLAVLLLLLRAAETCLQKTVLKFRRRDSDEWPRPNVRAVSLGSRLGPLSVDMPHGLETYNELPLPPDSPPAPRSDLPPPYSECADNRNLPNIVANKSMAEFEEPPPPYSACFVSFSNPKDGVPSVHFYNRHRQNLFDSDNGHCSQDQEERNKVETGCELRVRERDELAEVGEGNRDRSDRCDLQCQVTLPRERVELV